MSTTDLFVVDHAKIYVTERVMTICQQLGISIQPPPSEKTATRGPLDASPGHS
jgi:hypothetical protein